MNKHCHLQKVYTFLLFNFVLLLLLLMQVGQILFCVVQNLLINPSDAVQEQTLQKLCNLGQKQKTAYSSVILIKILRQDYSHFSNILPKFYSLRNRYVNHSSPQKSFNVDIGVLPCLGKIMRLSLTTLIVIIESRTFSFDVLLCMFKEPSVKANFVSL